MSQPDRPEGFFLLAMTAAEAGQIAKAMPMLEAAVARRPVAEHLAQYARLLILLRRDGDAAQAAYQALAMAPSDPMTLDTIGCVLARLGDHERSVPAFEGAVRGVPDNPAYRYNLAAACGFTARIDAARGHSVARWHCRRHDLLPCLFVAWADAMNCSLLET